VCAVTSKRPVLPVENLIQEPGDKVVDG